MRAISARRQVQNYTITCAKDYHKVTSYLSAQMSKRKSKWRTRAQEQVVIKLEN
jgi:hypothetical protein